MNDKILYTKKEAAEQLSLSVSSLDILIARGDIEVRQFGKRILVPRTELERLAKRDVVVLWPEKQNGKTTRQVA
jgi:excisionase family DNA binding protein